MIGAWDYYAYDQPTPQELAAEEAAYRAEDVAEEESFDDHYGDEIDGRAIPVE